MKKEKTINDVAIFAAQVEKMGNGKMGRGYPAMLSKLLIISTSNFKPQASSFKLQNVAWLAS